MPPFLQAYDSLVSGQVDSETAARWLSNEMFAAYYRKRKQDYDDAMKARAMGDA